MALNIVAAAFIGIGLGIFLQKGRFCFVHAFRDFFAFKDSRVTKGVLTAIVLTMIFWGILYDIGYYQGFWTPSWGITGLLGGFIFGVGMTYAGGCATGTLYRAGEGYLQFWITLLFMGVGYIVFTILFPTLKSTYFAPLTFGEGTTLFKNSLLPASFLAIIIGIITVLIYSTIIGRKKLKNKKGKTPSKVSTDTEKDLTAQLNIPTSTIIGLTSFYNGIKQYILGFTNINDSVKSLKKPWDPRTAALGITVLAIIWFSQVSIVGITGPEARWAGYLLNIVGINSANYEYWGSILFLGEGIRVTVDMIMITFVIIGSFLAATFSGDFRLRIPKKKRLPNAVIGGFMMGIGSRLAPGCNIGNIYSGIAELSIHSFIATIGIISGVYIMTHWLYRDVGCEI